jgi:hypothetical protein
MSSRRIPQQLLDNSRALNSQTRSQSTSLAYGTFRCNHEAFEPIWCGMGRDCCIAAEVGVSTHGTHS